jgi:hypothetical protein
MSPLSSQTQTILCIVLSLCNVEESGQNDDTIDKTNKQCLKISGSSPKEVASWIGWAHPRAPKPNSISRQFGVDFP